MLENVSRRSLVKGTAAGIAGAAALSLAGKGMPASASAEEAQAYDDGLIGFGSDPIPPVEEPESWDAEADVVVIGLGGAGLNASAYAAENGLSVIALERIGFAGGTVLEATNWFGAGSSLVPYDESDELVTSYYGTSVEDCASKYEPCDRDLMRALVAGNAECVDWMNSNMGCKWVREGAAATNGQQNTQAYGMSIIWDGVFPDGVVIDPSYTAVRGMLPATEHMAERIASLGVDTRFGVEATALVTDADGRVVGVQATDADGATVYIKGGKGVIIASGGFANNRDMLKKWCPTAYEGCSACATMFYHTGEGIRMAEGVGADFTGFDTFMTYNGGLGYYENGVGSFYHYMYSGDSALVRAQWLTVNKLGKRFTQTATGIDPSYHLAMRCMAQPGHRGYVIFDANYEENIFKLGPIGSGQPLRPEDGRIDVIPDGIVHHDWTETVAEALECGVIKCGDTIEELAEKLGIDAEGLAATVDEWNTCCATGEDPNWGETEHTLIPIEAGPFYGAEVGGFIWSTAAGLRVSPEMEVLDADGRKIAGLYASGSSIGGTKGYMNTLPAGPLQGAAESWTTGYLAAKKLVAEATA